MKFNKCNRCGAFYINAGDVCPNCRPKDDFEMGKLKNFLEENETNYSIESISYNTGISIKNLNRYFLKDNFISYKPNINL